MARRVFAWVLLAGFMLLLVNLIFLHFYWKESLFVYLIIAALFLFTNRKRKVENKEE